MEVTALSLPSNVESEPLRSLASHVAVPYFSRLDLLFSSGFCEHLSVELSFIVQNQKFHLLFLSIPFGQIIFLYMWD